MKKRRFIFVVLFALLVLCFCTCKKEEHYSIRGRLVSDCTAQLPSANVKLVLTAFSSGGCYSDLMKEAITNANGEFIFEYNGIGCDDAQLAITTSGGDGVVYGIQPNSDVKLGNTTYKNNFNCQLQVVSSSPYTQSDTLFYNIQYKDNGDSTFQFITGPFPATVMSKFSGPYSLNRQQKHFADIRCLFKTNGIFYACGGTVLPFYLYPPCGPEYKVATVKLP